MPVLSQRLGEAGFGVEVLDCDLAAIVDAGCGGASDDAQAIRSAWLSHRLLVFRDQHLEPRHQAAFASWFGPLERTTPKRQQLGDGPSEPVHYISNRVPGASAGDGELVFHSDSATRRYPIRAVTLFAEAVPSRGGETLFADAVAAWRTLDPRLRERVGALEAVHAFDYDSESKPTAAPGQLNGYSATHPVVMPHPLTGEPVLYVNRGQTWRLAGLDDAASDELLAALWDHVEAPERRYVHRWRVGDLVIWDNVALQHARTRFDPAEARTLRRVVVSGAPDGDRAFVA
jgi:taurine dioxygenase